MLPNNNHHLSNQFNYLFKSIAREEIEKVKHFCKDKTQKKFDDKNRNVFHYSSKIKNVKIIEILAKYFTDFINKADKFGEYPLHRAARYGNIEVVESLCSLGASPTVRDAIGCNILHIAVMKCQNQQMVALLCRKIDVNSQTDEGLSPLHIATNKGDLGIVKLLLEAGCDVNILNNHRETPLHYAASLDHIDICRALIKSKVNIDCANDNGNTALHLAVEKHNKCIVYLLLKNNAKYYVRNKRGETALELAERKKTLLMPLESVNIALGEKEEEKMRLFNEIIKALKKEGNSVKEIFKGLFRSSKNANNKENNEDVFKPYRRTRSCFD